MLIYAASFIAALTVAAGLAVGVLAGRPPIKGSCGGIACRNCRCKAKPEEEETL